MRAFSESFLGSLLHDLNVVHGMLERLGEPLPAEVVAGDWWNEGRAVYGALRLANGARVDGAWIQLLDTFEYRETIQFMFAEEVHTLEFPSPWLKQHPTIYRRSRRDGRADDVESSDVLRRVVRPRAAALPRLHRRRARRAGRRPSRRGSTSTC